MANILVQKFFVTTVKRLKRMYPNGFQRSLLQEKLAQQGVRIELNELNQLINEAVKNGLLEEVEGASTPLFK